TEVAFLSKDPVEIKGTWSTDVGLTDATIQAEVNPLGIPAEAFFEYVDDANFQASEFDNAVKAPATPIDLGGGEAFVEASTQIGGLQPNTLYHYRVVVSNIFVDEVQGEPESLLTFPLPGTIPSCANDAFRIGLPSEGLPDCRAFEMVSPIDKNGGDIKVLVQALSYPARLDQSADSGDAFTYSSVAAFAEPQSSLWSSQYLARRNPGGWSTEAINQPKDSNNLIENPVLKLDVQYRHFSSDLSNGWVSQYASPPLDECAPEGFINLYRRDNATGAYEALVPATPTDLSNKDPRIELQGLSADESKAVFRANAKLTPDASSKKDINQLYMHTRDPEGGCGQLTLISRKPSGTPITDNSSVGSPKGMAEYRRSTVARAVAKDGLRVVFSTGAITDTENGPLYVRVNTDLPQGPTPGGKCATPVTLGCTLEISSEKAQFWTAATDGSRVVYSVGENLFEYDVDKAMAGQPAVTQIAGGAKGVVGASEDAARIYFISDEQIDSEGVAGEPNLYLYEPGKADEYRLVATLSQRDLSGIELFGLAVGVPTPIANGVRISADGSHLAFVSQASLTGYDNLDAITGEPAIEVYLYDTTSAQVRCISCNPSGSRPVARKFEEGTVRYVAAMMAPGESQTFAPRSLSADGNRLFFESFDALLPSDVNKGMDVYEWQRAGSSAECQAKGMELYVPASGGCLALISSGTEETDTEFADASPDGSDVFIRTLSSLVPQDPGQIDVYDVREGGGFPVPSPPRPACEGEACVGPAPGPPADT
ncbi:MAG TPA: hypothetical protein VFX85_08255, partial [Solirubrobacterales bacterium]|nr:hypothetical protein [Solirubrobacterales bacterium]